MSIMRFSARCLLASFFIVDGSKALSNPHSRIPEAERILQTTLPITERLAPSVVAEYLPDNPKTWVKALGIAQVVGGLGLAFGIVRRPAAALLATTMVPHLVGSKPIKHTDRESKSVARALFLRNLALLGGVALAAQDTEGRPGLAWRAAKTKHRLATQGQKLHHKPAKKNRATRKSTKEAVGV